MYRFGRLVGFVAGCMIAALGAPVVCFAADPAEAVETQAAQNDDGHWMPLGRYKVTFYCSCARCCGKWAKYGRTASGTVPVAGRTAACGSLPLGTHVFLMGQEYVVEDRGVKGDHIDVYMDSHSEALKAGVKHADVFRWVQD